MAKKSARMSTHGWRASAKILVKMSILTVANVNLIPAIDAGEKVSLNQLHSSCNGRLEERLFCPACKKEIIDKETEIVRGYRQSDGNYIVLTKNEIESCKKESTGLLDIFQFISPDDKELTEIDYQKAHFLEPEKDGLETFGLMLKLFQESGQIGLSKIVLRQHDHLYAIRALKERLVAYELYFPNMVRDIEQIAATDVDVDDDTLKMGLALVKKMTRPYDRNNIHDEWTEGIRAMIDQKTQGQVIDTTKKVAIAPSKIVNLKDALAQALADA